MLLNYTSPTEIKIGTIFEEHWLNSCSFYEVVSTSEKMVVLAPMNEKQVRFECEGGCTGYSYVVPNGARYSDTKRTKVHFENNKIWIRGLHGGSLREWDGKEVSEYYE